MPAPCGAQSLDIRVGALRALEANRMVVRQLAAEITARLPDQQVRALDTPEPVQQVLDGVRNGTITLAVLPFSAVAPSAEAALSPWQNATVQAANRALNSEVGALAAAELEQSGAYALAFTTVAFSRLATRSASAPDAERLASLSIQGKRIISTGAEPSLSSRVIAQLGASSATLAGGEVFAALERG